MQTLKYIVLIIVLIVMHYSLYNSEHLKRVDYKIYDVVSLFSSKIKEKNDAPSTIIVDIDGKSLNSLGQWPWPRWIDAKLINSIYELHPSAIGVNILFSEKDRVSPVTIQSFYKRFFGLEIKFNGLPSALKDNDKILSQSIEKTGSTIATYFINSDYNTSYCEELSYRDNMFKNIETEHMVEGLLCNYETIQNGVKDFGFINAWVDSDGIFRRVPLFMKYKERIFPSLALATLLSFDKNLKIENDDTLLIDSFKKKPKVFSAMDILEARVPADEIQGKVVIVGSSVVGLNPTYRTSSGQSISNSMIHALVADSILSNTTLTQPKVYKKINILLSFFFSTLIVILFIKRIYIQAFFLFLVTLTISVLSVFYSYMNGVYISIGYFGIPFLYVFVLFVIFYSIKIDREKQEQEKILIIQSKLASMGEMIALIAHQWRQPLSSINGTVMSIDVDNRKKILDDEKLDKHLNQIEETTAYLSKTINDFTDFFSTNKKSEMFHIRDIVKQTESLTVISSHKNIDITYSEKEDIQVVGYSSELIQSLLILLNNAIYACQKNLQNIDKGKIRIDAYIEKNRVFITVKDNGGGIEERDIKKIFDPYFTTKDKENGTGLGLYILKLIVEESMNGKIFVSNWDDGAMFTIQIPTKN